MLIIALILLKTNTLETFSRGRERYFWFIYVNVRSILLIMAVSLIQTAAMPA